MSGTFISQYFQAAKQRPNDPALGFFFRERIRWIPHWLIHSKVKHFAMGLMDLRAMEGGYFYLRPFNHPEGVYTLLAAFSLGLPTITLPPDTPRELLEAWTRQYHPAFLYSENVLPSDWEKLFSQKKSFRAFLYGGESHFPPGEFHFSFRQIHNRGIMVEPSFFEIYRHRHESLTRQQWISPFRFDPSGRWVDRPLTFQDCQTLLKEWEVPWKDKKLGRIFAQVDFTKTLDQLLGIIWPLASLRQAVLAREPADWLGPPAFYAPQLAYLTPPGIQKLRETLAPRLKSFWSRLRAKRLLGGKLQEVWTSGPLADETKALLLSLGILTREIRNGKLSLEKA